MNTQQIHTEFFIFSIWKSFTLSFWHTKKWSQSFKQWMNDPHILHQIYTKTCTVIISTTKEVEIFRPFRRRIFRRLSSGEQQLKQFVKSSTVYLLSAHWAAVELVFRTYRADRLRDRHSTKIDQSTSEHRTVQYEQNATSGGPRSCAPLIHIFGPGWPLWSLFYPRGSAAGGLASHVYAAKTTIGASKVHGGLEAGGYE